MDTGTAAREIVDRNRYLTVATADGAGRPWPSPVWYAHDDYRAFLWVSRPGARHSGNIAERPEVGIVIFDSTVPVGGAAAVYAEAVAEEVGAAERRAAIATFSGRSVATGLRSWGPGDVSGSAELRLYRATVSELFVLGPGDRRLPFAV
jgi:nitroimidazol reductase NimA-like FMN-containing flavoprotein (pyridoxamine 5'-phosphate oxidase superfamily)